MRNSMGQLTPQFSTNRAVREYTERFYLPAASAYHARAADGGGHGAEIANWIAALDEQWPSVRIADVKVQTVDQRHRFEVHVQLGKLTSDDITAELYAEATAGDGPVRVSMQLGGDRKGDDGAHRFIASVTDDRPAAHYTARVLPQHSGVPVPLEAAHIVWQR
jgi:starch phosphorylase